MPMFERHDYYPGGQVSTIIVDDFTSDGVDDMALLMPDRGIVLSHGNGDGTFTEHSTIKYDVTDKNNYILTDDFNRDGNRDILVSSKIYLGDGTGYSFDEVELDYSGELPPLTGDVTGDGYPDLLTINAYEEDGHAIRELWIAPGIGNGTFGEPLITMLPGASRLYLQNINDFNGDTMPDILINYLLEYDEYGPLFKPTAPISFYNIGIMMGNGDGTFEDIIATKGYGAKNPNDFNNDGILDVVGNIYATFKTYVMLGDGKGSFEASWQSSEFNYGGPRYFILDINNDDVLDIGFFIASDGEFVLQEIEFLFGTGDGTFINPTDYPTVNLNIIPFHQNTFVSDLNNDSFDDFIVAPTDSSFVSIFINSSIVTAINNPEKRDTLTAAPFALYQSHPNPFNPSTSISYTLPESAEVKLTVYNALGTVAGTIVDEWQPAGTHTVEWDGSQHGSGVYFYRIETGEFTDTKRMVLVK